MATAKPAPDVSSDESGFDYLVVWAAVSVHIGGSPEPVTVAQGEKLPDGAREQGPFLRSIGAVTVVARQ